MRCVRAFRLGIRVERSQEVERLEGELEGYARAWAEVLERRGERIGFLENRLRDVGREGGRG